MAAKLAFVVVLALNISLTLTGRESRAAKASETVTINEMPASELYEVLARTCSESSWKTFSDWANRTDLKDQMLPEETYIASERVVRASSRNFALTVRQDGKLQASFDGQNLTGLPCDMIAQVIQLKSKKADRAGIIKLLIPESRAADLQTEFSNKDKAELATLIIGSAAVGCEWTAFTPFMAVGTLAGGVVGAGLAYSDFKLKNAKFKSNRHVLELELERILNSKQFAVKSCGKLKVVITSGAKTVTILKHPEKSIVISGQPGSTGSLGSHSDYGMQIWDEYANCNSTPKAAEINQQASAEWKIVNGRLIAPSDQGHLRPQSGIN